VPRPFSLSVAFFVRLCIDLRRAASGGPAPIPRHIGAFTGSFEPVVFPAERAGFAADGFFEGKNV
jgi:hypothetical protein